MSEQKQLQVGDVIYLKGNYGLQEKITIERLTNTTAISGWRKFKKEYSDEGWIRRIGNHQKWQTAFYYIETEELKDEWERQVLTVRIKTHPVLSKLHLLSDDQLRGLDLHLSSFGI